MPRQFTLNGPIGTEVPANTTLIVDETQRKLVLGETYAFRDRDGAHFLARIDSVAAATKGVVERDGCEVIGKLVGWRPVLH
jgi:hypothetical protein